VLKFYGTSNCHLCEQAEAILRGMRLSAEKIDIAKDDVLMAKYGNRIPLLRRVDNNMELGWPFDEAAVTQFIY